MTLCQTLFIVSLLLGSAFSSLYDSSNSSVAEIEKPQASSVTLTWTEDTQGWSGGDWNGGVAAAASHVEQGFTDWRLPTIQELQAALTIAYGQPGSWGQDLRNPGGTGNGWTSKSQGIWAWRVTIAEDANGFVIPSQSGQASKVLKGSNFARTKFVRP